MTEKERELRKCFEDTIWMAIRYANGRHTYAPYVVRDAVNTYKKLYPDWELKFDDTIFKDHQRFSDHPEVQNNPEGDWLIDLYKQSPEQRCKALKDMMQADERAGMYE